MSANKPPEELGTDDLDMAVAGAAAGGGIGKGTIMEGMEDPVAVDVAKGEQRHKAIVIDRKD